MIPPLTGVTLRSLLSVIFRPFGAFSRIRELEEFFSAQEVEFIRIRDLRYDDFNLAAFGDWIFYSTQTPQRAPGKCSLACFISSLCALILSIFILCIGSFKRASAFYASPLSLT